MGYSKDMALQSKFPALWERFLKRIDEALQTTTQEELGRRLGVGKSAITKWRHGLTRGADLQDFLRYCDVLGIDLGGIVAGTEITTRQKEVPPVTAIDRRVLRELASSVERQGLSSVAAKAFPDMQRTDRENLLASILAGQTALTLGIFCSVAQACVELKPGAYLDSSIASLAFGTNNSAFELEESPPRRPMKGMMLQERSPDDDNIGGSSSRKSA